jgi:hypothetical protein
MDFPILVFTLSLVVLSLALGSETFSAGEYKPYGRKYGPILTSSAVEP